MTTFPHPHVTVDWLKKRADGSLPGFMGVQPVEVAEKKLVARLEIQKHHTAPNGYLHAASVIALADTTCGYATLAHMPDGGKNFTTIELKSTHVWDAEVVHEETGKTIALFRCTQMILK